MRQVDGMAQACITYGWTNLLYINNIYPVYNLQGVGLKSYPCVFYSTEYLNYIISYYLNYPLLYQSHLILLS